MWLLMNMKAEYMNDGSGRGELVKKLRKSLWLKSM